MIRYKSLKEEHSNNEIKKTIIDLVQNYKGEDLNAGRFPDKFKEILIELTYDFDKFKYLRERVDFIIKKLNLNYREGTEEYSKLKSLLYFLNRYKIENLSKSMIKKYNLKVGMNLKSFTVIGGLLGDNQYKNGTITFIDPHGNITISISKGDLSIPASRLKI